MLRNNRRCRPGWNRCAPMSDPGHRRADKVSQHLTCLMKMTYQVGCGLSVRKWRKMAMAVNMARRARLLCLPQIQMPVCHLPEDFRPVHWSIQHLSLPGYRKTSQQRKGREVVRTSQEKHKPHFPPPV